MTSRMSSQIQATEMSFLWTVTGFSFRARVSSSDNREELRCFNRLTKKPEALSGMPIREETPRQTPRQIQDMLE